MIEFKNVYLQYVKEYCSLYNVSFVIKNSCLIVGDYDATISILRLISKFENNYKGDIFIDNINIKNINNKDLNLSFLPKKPILFNNKNIFKNLYYPLNLQKISKNNAKNMIKAVFFKYNLQNLFKNEKNINFSFEDFLKIKIKNLNINQQKLIAILRAILKQPKYILLEDFFDDDTNFDDLFINILNDAKTTSNIILTQKNKLKNPLNIEKIIAFENGSLLEK